jgi:NAD(P)-dependent dehydrogenase (short-subunit alcohol dehydrogenase family)
MNSTTNRFCRSAALAPCPARSRIILGYHGFHQPSKNYWTIGEKILDSRQEFISHTVTRLMKKVAKSGGPKRMKKFDLAGRHALVTGGAQGLGAGMAAALAEAGAAVMIGDVQEGKGRDTAGSLAATGAKTGFTRLDVTSEADWERALAATIATLGGFDILINNAGIEVTALVADIEPESMRKMLDVNIVGTALGMKHAFRAMRPDGAAGKGGAVVNVSSVAATIAFPSIAAYSATKSAVDRLTRVGAAEAGKLGYGVRVNCIYPGLVATEMGLKLATDIVALGLATDVNAAV